MQLTPSAVKIGVIVILEVAGLLPVLTAVNAAIFPVPEAASPMAILLLVQLKVVALPENVRGVVEVPAQTVCVTVFTETVGDGFVLTTAILLTVAPAQPL